MQFSVLSGVMKMDAGPFKQGFRQADSALQGFSAKLGQFSEAISVKMQQVAGHVQAMAKNLNQSFQAANRGFTNVTTAAAGLVTAAGGVSVAMVKLASNANEAASKFQFVFTTASDKTQKSLDEFAKAAGRSKYAMREMAADIGALVGPMGFTKDKTGELSVQFTKLAVDLSSFFNVTEDDALVALRAAIVGESEPMRRLGVQLNEAKIQAEAFKLGIAKSKDEVQGAIKTQAIFSIIMRETATAQGDAVRTSGAFANSWRAMRDTIKDTATDLGQVFIPVATKAVQAIRAFAEPMATWAAKNQDVLQAKLADWAERVSAGAVKIGKSFYATFEYLKPTIVQVWNYASGLLQSFQTWFNGLPAGTQQVLRVATASTALGLALGKIGGMVPIIGPLATAFGSLINPIGLVGGAVKLIIPLFGAGTGLLGVFGSVLGMIVSGGPLMIALAALAAMFLVGGDFGGAVEGLGTLLKGLAGDGFDFLKASVAGFSAYLKGDGLAALEGYHNAMSSLSSAAAKLSGAIGLDKLSAAFAQLAEAQKQLAGSEGRGSRLDKERHENRVATYGSEGAAKEIEAAEEASQKAHDLESKHHKAKQDLVTTRSPWYRKLTETTTGMEANERTLKALEAEAKAARAHSNVLEKRKIEIMGTPDRPTSDEARILNAAEHGNDIKRASDDYGPTSENYAKDNRPLRKSRKANWGGRIDKAKIAEEERIREQTKAQMAQSDPLIAKEAATGDTQAQAQASVNATPSTQAATTATAATAATASNVSSARQAKKDAASAARQAKKDAASAARQAKKDAAANRSTAASDKAAKAMGNAAVETTKLTEAEQAAADKAAGKQTPAEAEQAASMKGMMDQAMQHVQQAGQQAFQQIGQQMGDAGKAAVVQAAQANGQLNAMINDAKAKGNPLAALDLIIQNVKAKAGMASINLHNMSDSLGSTGSAFPGSDNSAYAMSQNGPAATALKGFTDLLASLQKQRATLVAQMARSKAPPKLAEGGIVSSSLLANIGESGPEAVIPLQRLGQVLASVLPSFGSFNAFGVGPFGQVNFGAVPAYSGMGISGLTGGPFGSPFSNTYLNTGALGAFDAAFSQAQAGTSFFGNLGMGGAGGWAASLKQMKLAQQQAVDALNAYQQHSQINLQPMRGLQVLGGTNPLTGAPWAGRDAYGNSTIGAGGARYSGNTSEQYQGPNITINHTINGADMTDAATRQRIANQMLDHLDAAARQRGIDMTGQSVLRSRQQPYNAAPTAYAR
ncbi:MAG TPA: hypothetical protein VMV69_08815 [Pirellulales bacterium]|nr:hypothetical protein [Pirellulales bacterium]